MRKITLGPVELEIEPQHVDVLIARSSVPQTSTAPSTAVPSKLAASDQAAKRDAGRIQTESSSIPLVNESGHRFIDNGDNTVTDLQHGLMWVKNPGKLGGGIGEFGVPAEVDWATANQACEELVFAGYSDWRLPTAAEWEGLCDDIPNFNPEEYLEECRNNWYWTSSESKNKPGKHYAALTHFKQFKTAGPWGSSTELHVRPVRDAR